MKLMIPFLLLFSINASAAQFSTCDIAFFNDKGFVTDHEADYAIGKTNFVLVSNDAKIVAHGDQTQLTKELATPIEGHVVLLKLRSAQDLEVTISPVRPTADDKASEVVKLDTIGAKVAAFPLTLTKNLPGKLILSVFCSAVYSMGEPAN